MLIETPEPRVARDAFEALLIRDYITRKLATWEWVSPLRAWLWGEPGDDGRWPIVIWEVANSPEQPGVVGWVWIEEVNSSHGLMGAWELPAFADNGDQRGPIDEPPVIDWRSWPEP